MHLLTLFIAGCLSLAHPSRRLMTDVDERVEPRVAHVLRTVAERCQPRVREEIVLYSSVECVVYRHLPTPPHTSPTMPSRLSGLCVPWCISRSTVQRATPMPSRLSCL